MIGYVTLGTNNLEQGAKFYDELLAEIGAKRFLEVPGHFIAWSVHPEQPGLSITKPFDGNTATAGNGTMVAMAVEQPAQVDALHAKAMQLGATDEGAPGQRGDGFYAGYFRDLDGNKMNFFCLTPQP